MNFPITVRARRGFCYRVGQDVHAGEVFSIDNRYDFQRLAACGRIEPFVADEAEADEPEAGLITKPGRRR